MAKMTSPKAKALSNHEIVTLAVYLLGGPHELRVADGAPIGRLVVKDSQAWGLGPLFSRRGGDPGDSLRILFDLKTKIATAELGQASVEEADEVAEQSA
jgi:hypothetical protein